MAFTYVYLRVGQGYRVATGAGAPARIRATPLVEMANGPTVINQTVTIPLDGSGLATRPIAATTDPDTLPVDVPPDRVKAYRFEVEAGGRVLRTVTAAVPHDQGGTVDLSSLIALGAPPELRPGEFRLADAADVADTPATLGQMPRWDGAQWVPATILPETIGAAAAGSGSPDAVTSSTIRTIVTLTQAEYTALSVKDPTVLYVISG